MRSFACREEASGWIRLALTTISLHRLICGDVPFVECQTLRSFRLTQRYDTRCCFNVRSEADMSQLNLPHGTDN